MQTDKAFSPSFLPFFPVFVFVSSHYSDVCETSARSGHIYISPNESKQRIERASSTAKIQCFFYWIKKVKIRNIHWLSINSCQRKRERAERKKNRSERARTQSHIAFIHFFYFTDTRTFSFFPQD
jgi:hypothetical protein